MSTAIVNRYAFLEDGSIDPEKTQEINYTGEVYTVEGFFRMDGDTCLFTPIDESAGRKIRLEFSFCTGNMGFDFIDGEQILILSPPNLPKPQRWEFDLELVDMKYPEIVYQRAIIHK